MERIFLPIDLVNNRLLNADEATARRNISLQQGEDYEIFLKFLSGSSAVTPAIDEFSFLIRDNPSATEDILRATTLVSGSGSYPYKFSLEVSSVPLQGRLAGYTVREFSSQFVWTEDNEIEVIGPISAPIYAATSEYTGNLTYVETLNGLDGTVTISGQNGISVETDGNVILIGVESVDFSPYATKTALAATGQTLEAMIAATGASAQGQINAINAATGSLATAANLAATGSALSSSVSSLTSNLAATGGALSARVSTLENLSGEWATKSALGATGAALAARVGTLEGLTGSYATNSALSAASGVLSSRIEATGAGLNSRIFTLEGLTGGFVLDSETGVFATAANLAATGSSFSALNAFNVKTTGNQSVSGNKSFLGNISATHAAGTSFAVIDDTVYLRYPNDEIALSTELGTLHDVDGSESMNWSDRVLVNGGVSVLDWFNKQLVGQWTTNFTPSSSGHIVNKGYFDSRTGALSGEFVRRSESGLFASASSFAASDAFNVKTTGAQNISGNKTYFGVNTFRSTLSVQNGGVNTFEVGGEIVTARNALGNTVFTTNELVASDADGIRAMQWGDRSLYSTSNENVLNWNAKELYQEWTIDTQPMLANGIVNKAFFDARTGTLTGAFVRRSESGQFASTASVAALDAFNVKTTGNQNVSGNKTFAGNTTFQENITATNLFEVSQDNGTVVIRHPSTVAAFSTDDSMIKDLDGADSIAFGLRQLCDISSNVTVDWNGKVLQGGDWFALTVPTLSGHIVNKGYFDAQTGALTGEFVRRAESGNFASDLELAAATGALTGAFYPRTSNPSGFIMSSQTGAFASDLEVAAATGALTGAFLLRSETGQFGISGGLSAVRITGDQRILGEKSFETIKVSGDGVIIVELSDDAFTVSSFGTQTFNAGSRILSDINGNQAILWGDRLTMDGNNVYSLDWSSRRLYDEDALPSVNWDNRTLLDVDSITTLNWNDATLMHPVDIIPSLDWRGRGLIRSNSETGINWEGRQLTGTWSNNGNPTASGHIINKGYFDARTGTLTGQFAPLNTTGALSGTFAARNLSFTETSGGYTISHLDVGRMIEVTGSFANTLTIPTGAAQDAIPTGAQFLGIQVGTGVVSVTGQSGIAIRSRGSQYRTNGQYAEFSLIKKSALVWYLAGDLIA